MKKLLLLTAIIFMISCKDKKKSDYQSMLDSIPSYNPIPILPINTPVVGFEWLRPDTSIHQEVSYSKSHKKYILQTWISFGFERLPFCFKYPNPYKANDILGKESDYYRLKNGYAADTALYCSEIAGTFHYIEWNKQHEYDKALTVFLTLKNKSEKGKAIEKAIEDSVEILKKL